MVRSQLHRELIAQLHRTLNDVKTPAPSQDAPETPSQTLASSKTPSPLKKQRVVFMHRIPVPSREWRRRLPRMRVCQPPRTTIEVFTQAGRRQNF